MPEFKTLPDDLSMPSGKRESHGGTGRVTVELRLKSVDSAPCAPCVPWGEPDDERVMLKHNLLVQSRRSCFSITILSDHVRQHSNPLLIDIVGSTWSCCFVVAVTSSAHDCMRVMLKHNLLVQSRRHVGYASVPRSLSPTTVRCGLNGRTPSRWLSPDVQSQTGQHSRRPGLLWLKTSTAKPGGHFGGGPRPGIAEEPKE